MFSIIMPMDTNRLEQFKVTKQVYDAMPQIKEFVIPTRTYDKVSEYLKEHDLIKDVRLLPYYHEEGFNVSMALNIGTRNARYENIIITSPEVKPLTPVLEQFSESLGENIVCQVSDEDVDHIQTPLVHNGFRNETPAMYFLAMFQKKDIEAINGWDEEFMKGYAYEDNDFGARWVRAKLPFTIREDIRGLHQYHPRAETISGGAAINQIHYHRNTDQGVICPTNGLVTLGESVVL